MKITQPIRATLPLLALLCALSTYGQTMDPFVTTWETTTADESIIIPTHTDGTYNYSVTWEDGGTPEAGKTGDATHEYATPGTHTVSITGDFPRIYFNDFSSTITNADKIRTIAAWGNIAWTSMAFAFTGCSKLTSMAMDLPNLSGVTDMTNMFRNAGEFNGNLSNWDVSKVTNMQGMFNSATAFNGDLSNWDVSNVKNMTNMFAVAVAFNGNLSNWNVSKVTTMEGMFFNAGLFNGDISNWDVSMVTDMLSMFEGASVFNRDIGNWDVSRVTNMKRMFFNARVFNQDLGNWNVSRVTTMRTMFANATAFNQDISRWDVSSVNDMGNMFFNATAFDGNLGNWDVSKVNNFGSFLSGAELSSENYDALLIGWNKLDLQSGRTFHGGNSQYTSAGAAARTTIDTGDGWTIADGGEVDMTVSFAENDAGTVTDIDGDAMATMYDLAAPTAGNKRDDDNLLFSIDNMGALSFMSAPDFEDPRDAGMNNIYAVEVTVGTTKVTVSVSVTNMNEFSPVASMISNLSLAKDFGTRLIDLSGTFTDGDMDMLTLSVSTSSPSAVTATIAPGGTTLTLTEQGLGESVITVTANDGSNTGSAMFTVTVSLPFVTTWKTDGAMESITIPTHTDGTYNYTVNWGDGMEDTEVTGNAAHTYADAGTYRVTITGDFPRIYFNDVGNTDANADRILTIEKWGDIAWTSMNNAFTGCSKLTSAGTDLPDLSGVTDMSSMFSFAADFTGNLGNWNVSSVTNMQSMFTAAIAFNQDLSNWNVSSVNNMEDMFAAARAFNQDISRWDVSSVNNMRNMFGDAVVFNQNLSNWNVSSVISMRNMFLRARAFDQDIGNWDVSAVTDFTNFLANAELSSENYDALLVGWNALTLQNGVTFHAGSSQYTSTGAVARQAIIDDDNWTITDGGLVIVATFDENGAGTVTDIDGGVMASYALAAPTTGNSNDDDNALFNIDMSTGVLTFKDSPDFEDPQDANRNNIYAVEVTVTAGSIVTKTVVSVSVTNVNPVIDIEISDRSLDTGFRTEDIDLSGTFTGDDVMLTVVSANVAVVTAAIAPGTTMLTLTEVGGGESVITVTANDGSNTVSDEFTVTVAMVTGVAEAGRSLSVYPNPGSESLTVEMEGTWSLVRIYDFTGRHLHVPVRERGPQKSGAGHFRSARRHLPCEGERWRWQHGATAGRGAPAGKILKF